MNHGKDEMTAGGTLDRSEFFKLHSGTEPFSVIG
jgi:hypothetical protein